MSRRIYKYTLMEGVDTTVRTRQGWQPLSVQLQDGVVTLWALIDLNAPEADVYVHCYGTGWPLPTEHLGVYLGSVQTSDGLVWHYWETR